MLSRSLFIVKLLRHLRWYVMVGSSSPTIVFARSKIGAYCRISAALTSVFHDYMSCTNDRSPEYLVQCLKQSFLISTQRRFLGGPSDSTLIILLILCP